MHAPTAKDENSAQGFSCKLKFVHDSPQIDIAGNGDNMYCTIPCVNASLYSRLFLFQDLEIG
jgi:hypothetical protein